MASLIVVEPGSSFNQKQPLLLSCDTIFRQRIGPQIVPLLTHPVASFAYRPRLPPAEFLSWFPSCCLGEAGKKAVDAGSVLDMLQEPGLSSLHHA